MRILFVFFLLLSFPAHASNDFYRCLIALNSGVINQEPAKLDTEKFTFNGLVIKIPPKAVRFAKYISADDTLTIEDQVVLLLTLEEMFNPQHLAQADIPLEAALQRKLNLLLNIPESKKDDTYPKEVTFITHQQTNMQDSTARLLTENASLQNTHTIVLGSKKFPIVSKDLIVKANTVQHSEGGEIDYVPPLATRFNLMGGYCNYCLTQSVGSIINAKLSERSLDPINIYIYTSQSYVLGKDGGVITAAAALQKVQKHADTLLSESFLDLPGSARLGKADYDEGATGPSYRIPLEGSKRPIFIHILPQ